MSTLICGSIAFDSIMLFKGRFRDHILPDQVHILNVAFLVPELRRVAPSVDGKIRPLPNLVSIPPAPAQSRVPQPPCFVSILDLNVYRKKGFHWLIPAFAIAARAHPDATLDVFGWSNERVDAELRLLVAAAGCGVPAD